MSIDETYSEIITEDIIKEILSEGESPSVSEITTRYNAFVAANDITAPLFDANNYTVDFGEASSVTKYNGTNEAIHQDLRVLYRHLFKTSEQSIATFNRWRAEAQLLEGRLGGLEQRIEALLLLAEDTAGYFNFVQDNFANNTYVDLPNTTAYVNVNKGLVSIGTSSLGATRIDLTALNDKDIVFTILSRNNLTSTVIADSSRLKHAVSDATDFWHERVYTNAPGPMSTELVIDMLSSQTFSRIDVDLHMANQNSTVQLTPMYSTDNYNWKQLPITNFTRSVVDKTTFQFSPVTGRYVKFIMTKLGFDQVHNGSYAYEFGVDEISFYNEGFAASTDAIFISKPLSVTDDDGIIEQFSRIVLEVCEDIPDNTSINYYVAASNDENNSLAGFAPIDPISRATTVKPTVLDFGDLDTITVSGIQVSYNANAAALSDINPDKSYTIIQSIASAAAVTASGQASASHYSFLNSNDRILDHAVASGVAVATGTMELWRNVSVRNNENKVRSYVNGWGFDDPYYRTTVYVGNAAGHSVDFGGQKAVLDGAGITGQVTITEGRHLVQVHKDNWKEIDTTTVSGLASLKAVDSLYPYNHRYIVEGLVYPSSYPSTDEQIYRGFDIVAEYFMKQVSPFDLIHNVAADGYDMFAVDQDTPDTGRLIDGVAAATSQQSAHDVFLIKIDEGNPDFTNEEFMLRFKSANSLFTHLRFKAVLSTTDSSITPFLDSYRIKISS